MAEDTKVDLDLKNAPKVKLPDAKILREMAKAKYDKFIEQALLKFNTVRKGIVEHPAIQKVQKKLQEIKNPQAPAADHVKPPLNPKEQLQKINNSIKQKIIAVLENLLNKLKQ